MKREQAAKQLDALGNPARLKVYRPLLRAGGAGSPVGRLHVTVLRCFWRL
jgi:hypothetical protein